MAIRSHAAAVVARKVCALAKAAVRCGRLVKATACAWCGSYDDIQAHHPDYDRPLMVVWVCGACHREHHRRFRDEQYVLPGEKRSSW